MRNAISVRTQAGSRKGMARLSTMTHSACLDGATAGAAEVCGLWRQICSNCWIRGLTASGFFLFRGRDFAITMNSVKILHAVRSAITAIAELVLTFTIFIVTLRSVNLSLNTRHHSYRTVDRAMRPIYGCPEKFSESSLRTRLFFQKFVMDFCSDRC